jgi:hypothetical protein
VATRAGFHAHANLCGSIVRDCALGNAFEERKSTLGGDEESAAIKSLLRHAADRSCPDGREWRPAELLELAEECGMLDAICGWTRNPRQSLGHKLRNYRGRQFKDSKGRPFEFGKRDGSVGSIYQLRFLDE